MKIPKKAVQKAAKSRKKTKRAEAVKPVLPSPYSVRVLMDELPLILYKYTDDAGVAGMREGIVRFGSYQSYRVAEDLKIRDEFEHAAITRATVPCFNSRTGRIERMKFAMAFPGAIFCASANESLRGDAFGYNRRVAVKIDALYDAALNAAAQLHHIFRRFEDGEIVRPLFQECGDRPRASLNDFKEVPPKDFSVNLRMGNVQYVEDLGSNADPRGMMLAGSIGGEFGRRLIAKLTQDDYYMELRKQLRFRHEKEWRIMMSFSPRNDTRVFTENGDPILRCYHTDSFFVKIDNPRDVFTFDD